MLKTLLAVNAEVELRNGEGLTPIHAAARWGNNGAVWRLLEARADLDAADQSGCTALHSAASSGHVLALSMMLGAGASADVKNTRGATPMHVAASAGHDDAVTWLVKAGANVEAKDSDGNTPLHLAASRGHANVMKVLLAAGASVLTKNKAGATPRAAARDALKLDAKLRAVNDVFDAAVEHDDATDPALLNAGEMLATLMIICIGIAFAPIPERATALFFAVTATVVAAAIVTVRVTRGIASSSSEVRKSAVTRREKAPIATLFTFDGSDGSVWEPAHVAVVVDSDWAKVQGIRITYDKDFDALFSPEDGSHLWVVIAVCAYVATLPLQYAELSAVAVALGWGLLVSDFVTNEHHVSHRYVSAPFCPAVSASARPFMCQSRLGRPLLTMTLHRIAERLGTPLCVRSAAWKGANSWHAKSKCARVPWRCG